MRSEGYVGVARTVDDAELMALAVLCRRPKSSAVGLMGRSASSTTVETVPTQPPSDESMRVSGARASSSSPLVLKVGGRTGTGGTEPVGAARSRSNSGVRDFLRKMLDMDMVAR
jgi:hypothetical protein